MSGAMHGESGDPNCTIHQLIDLDTEVGLELLPVHPVFDLSPLPGGTYPNSRHRFIEPFPRDVNVPAVLFDNVLDGDEDSSENGESKTPRILLDDLLAGDEVMSASDDESSLTT
jgi:hypothetical protein